MSSLEHRKGIVEIIVKKPMFQVVSMAILDHVIKHQGLLPKKIIFHPEFYREFLETLPIHYITFEAFKTFEGVPLEQSIKEPYVKIITCQNDMEEL